jgi:uncharacterized protein (TIGR00725 family)
MKSKQKPIIGIMGPGSPNDSEIVNHARKLGREIARMDWILLTGGRAAGVMEAAARGASGEGGLTIGILPGNSRDQASSYIQIPVITGMGHARNVINILTSDVIVVCGMGPGTASEVSLAIKMNKPLIMTRTGRTARNFFEQLSGTEIAHIEHPGEIVSEIETLLNQK